MQRRHPPLLRWAAFALCLLGAAPLVDCGGGGSSSSGGGGGANCGECFRPIDCVKQCGGEVVQSGCCPCPTGTFDSNKCGSDAGHD